MSRRRSILTQNNLKTNVVSNGKKRCKCSKITYVMVMFSTFFFTTYKPIVQKKSESLQLTSSRQQRTASRSMSFAKHSMTATSPFGLPHLKPCVFCKVNNHCHHSPAHSSQTKPTFVNSQCKNLSSCTSPLQGHND